MSNNSRCRKRTCAGLEKTASARTVDAVFRGLSRGMSTKNFMQMAGRLSGIDTTIPATIASIPVALLSGYTSYAGTQWWTNDPDELKHYVASNHSSFFKTGRKATDAFLRGIARAEAAANSLILIGSLLDCDLLMPAGVLALLVLTLTSWSSYQRNMGRAEYAEALLPLSQHDLSHKAETPSHMGLTKPL